MTNAANPALSQWSLDREIVMSRVIDAPRDLVFEAWSDPKHLPQWFGPKGFKVETFEIDVRVGGVWRFNMIGPDGTVYPNRMRFRRIERPSLMEMDHGVDQDEDPGMFLFTVTFRAEQRQDRADDAPAGLKHRAARRHDRLRRRRIRLSDAGQAGGLCRRHEAVKTMVPAINRRDRSFARDQVRFPK